MTQRIRPAASGGRPSKLQEQIKQKPPGRAKRRTAIPKGTEIPFNRSSQSCRDLNLSSPHYLLIGLEAELSLQCATESPRYTVQNVAQRREEFTSNYSVCGHEVSSVLLLLCVCVCLCICFFSREVGRGTHSLGLLSESCHPRAAMLRLLISYV